jgi:CubicO group peptidase (beta-lactamase class C family)
MNHVDSLMKQAVEDRVFPGAVVLAAKHGRLIYHKAFGFLDHFKTAAAATDTVYDLASLTKPLATTAAVMHLVARGVLSIRDRAADLLPELGTSSKADIRIVHLLCHNSGLPAWRPYYRDLTPLPMAGRKRELHRLLAKEPLVAVIGKNTLYSDVGFMLLQWIVERVSGLGLDQYVGRHVYGPMDISELFFLPRYNRGEIHRPADRGVAATGVNENNEPIRGRVHDRNADAIGGVAGHAGLFGTAAGVFRFLSCLLEIYSGKAADPVFTRSTVTEFFRIPAGARRAVGFDVPEAENSSSGRYFSPASSVGHLGFTGTSFWMDPASGVTVILLSNRVCPDPENMKIKDFRPLLHDTVLGRLEA